VTGGSYRQYEFKPVGQNIESVHKKQGLKKAWWKIWKWKKGSPYSSLPSKLGLGASLAGN